MTNQELIQGQQLQAQMNEVQEKLDVLSILANSADERYNNSVVVTISPGSPNSCTINDRSLLAQVGRTFHTHYLQIYQSLADQFQKL